MKIIASDFDGTFTYGGVDEERRQAVRDWRAAGNRFGIVSGRGAGFLTETFPQYQVDYDFFVGHNGALVADAQGKILWEKTCPGWVIGPLLDFLVEHDCPECCVHNCAVIMPGHETRRTPVITKEEAMAKGDFLQMTTILRSREEAADMAEKIREKFGQWVNPLQNGGLIDIVARGVDKASGVRKMLELLGGREEDVIAVGDNINDRDMIREFPSYAVENAVEEIKKLADKVTPNVTEMIRTELAAE